MARKGPGQKIIWRLEALAYDFIGLLLRPFSFDAISAFGGRLLQRIGPMTSKHKIAETGLRTAFPDAADEQIDAWLDAQWNNTGRTFAEFPILHRLRVFEEQDRVTVEGIEHLEALRQPGKAALLVTGHFANWEIMAALVTQMGLRVQITYRKINNPYIDKRVREKRESYGTKLLVPKSGAKGARQLFEALNAGESVGILNDQKFNQGLAVPFFGVDAMTAPGPTRLALKTGVPIILLSTRRDKAKFTITVEPPVYFKKSKDRAVDIETGVRHITDYIEDRIREAPGQWFWVHRRWPKTHYKKTPKD